MQSIVIDSRQSLNQTPADCQFNYSNTFSGNRVKLASLVMPNTFYTVLEGQNTFTCNSTTITVPPGCYNSTNLMTAINAQLPSDVTVAVDSVTFCSVWTSSSPITLVFT